MQEKKGEVKAVKSKGAWRKEEKAKGKCVLSKKK